METRRLQYFIEVCKAGSMTRAATRLDLSQAALSQQIAILETEFKTRLLDRSRTGVKATAAGQMLLREAQIILRQVDQARGAVTAQSAQISGTVSVGFTTGAGALFVVPLMEQVQRLYPQIRLHFLEGMTGELTERIINGQLDLATLLRNENRAGVLSTPMFKEDLFLISPASFDLADGVRVAELETLRMILPSSRHTLRALYDAVFRQADITPNIIAEIDSVSMIRGAVLAGIGATIQPRSSWTSELQDGLVNAGRITDFPMQLSYWLSRSPSPPTAAAKAVCSVLEKIVAESAPVARNGDRAT
jgi:LysR family transcriptional regulator, regulatory protein for tcuABC